MPLNDAPQHAVLGQGENPWPEEKGTPATTVHDDQMFVIEPARSNSGDWLLLGGVGLMAIVAGAMFLRSNAPAASPVTPLTVAAAPTPVPAVPTYLQWDYSWENGQSRAAAARKPMMVEFYTDWCPACKSMDARVFNDQSVIAESANFISIKINAEARADIAQRYNIRAYPTTVWMSSNGGEYGRLVGGEAPGAFAGRMRQYNITA
jgi:thiol:disulfide interchange protein DsbD